MKSSVDLLDLSIDEMRKIDGGAYVIIVGSDGKSVTIKI